MRLLILTQKVDINDDVLGFFHNWIKAFAKNAEKITVIALGAGEYNLPENVKVLSLGKESGRSNIKYIFRFYKYIWQERRGYDEVFIHMNKEYVILGGWFWRLSNKKIILWYNHKNGNFFSMISGLLANSIFFTSPFSYFSKWKKAGQMPAGIDTGIFKKDDKINKIVNSLLCLGRISPVKNVDVLIKAATLLDKSGEKFILNIIGEPGENDGRYFKQIRELSAELEKKEKIKFLGKVANYHTPKQYNQNEIYINMSDSGSLDKTALEAMACESLVLACNKSFESIFPSEWHQYLIFQENDEQDLAGKIEKLIKLEKEKKEKIMKKSRRIVLECHNLDKLINEISENLK